MTTGAEPGSDGAADARRCERGLGRALIVASFLFFLLLDHGHFTGSDELGVFEMTRSLVERGRLDVPPIRHTEVGRDGLRYSYFAPGQSVLAIPFYGLGALAGAALPDSWARVLAGPVRRSGHHIFGGELEIAAVSLFSPVVSALLVALFFRFQRELGVSIRSALLACGLLAGTTHLTVLSTYFLRHSTEALLVLGSVYFLFRWGREGRTRELAIGCCLASAVLLVRVPAALVAPPLAGYLLWLLVRQARERGGDLPWRAWSAAIALPLIAALALHALVNLAKWESLFSSPMMGQHGRFGTPLSLGLAGLLVSPGSSVFLYSPLLLLTPWTLTLLARRHRAEVVFIASTALLFLVVFAHFDGWSGLWSAPGPRYLFLPIPLLMLPLGLWLDQLRANDSVLRRRLQWGLIVTLALAGAWVQTVSTVVRWGAVPEIARYPFLNPDHSGMLFELHRSPVVVMSRLFLEGAPFDPWLLTLGRGWPGTPAMPGLAIALTIAWCVCIALALRAVLREARRCEDAHGSTTLDSC